MSDTLGRPACIAQLLRRAQVAPAELCTESRVLPVLRKLLDKHPHWITMLQSPGASASVMSVASPLKYDLAPCVQEWVPIFVKDCCGAPLARWKLVPATFITLASGFRSGHVVCFRCLKCKSAYAGCWKWSKVHDLAKFPEGHHSPKLVSTPSQAHRWFFATPQLVVEVILLDYVLGLLARGGISFTGFFAVYTTMWGASMQGTMYAARAPFISKLELNVIVYATTIMFAESDLCVKDFVWTLRPHHIAMDFESLLAWFVRHSSCCRELMPAGFFGWCVPSLSTVNGAFKQASAMRETATLSFAKRCRRGSSKVA